MLVNEIFSSIEGEGIRAGYPVTFIRLYGCNLHCSYCDTRYSCEGGDYEFMSIDEILKVVADLGFHRVTLTGGEPLIHRDVNELILTLINAGYEVNIETNGAVYIAPYTTFKKLIITLDYKSISSGENESMWLSNIPLLRKRDVLKFVVGSQEDLDDMRRIVVEYNPICSIYVSPVFGKIEPKEIVEYIKEHKLENCRVQLQMHKFIWPPQQRGV